MESFWTAANAPRSFADFYPISRWVNWRAMRTFAWTTNFERSGFVLQDTVNEIGKRLGYQVTHGRYSGVQNEVGFDGLWFDGTSYLVVEVKTTDAYRINLDKVCGYGSRLEAASQTVRNLTYSLIVVGRQDTGDLEAQVRGSRHAWSVRLISVDALIKLMIVNDDLDDPTLIGRIRRVLLPFEYTRVDNIVDLVFDTQQEAETKASFETEAASEEDETESDRKSSFTPSAEIDAKRFSLVQAFFSRRHLAPVRRFRSGYSDESDTLRVTLNRPGFAGGSQP